MSDPRAGQPAQPSDLVDVPHLVTSYYAIEPDPADPLQQVVFGTSGHRGTSLNGSFNEAHILATTQAICEYRRDQGYDGPLFVGRDTHGLSEPAWVSALEVLAANDVTVLVDSGRRLHPDPRGLARDPARQRRPHHRPGAGRRHRRDAVAQPADRRRASSTTRRTADRPTPTRPAGSPAGPTSCWPRIWLGCNGFRSPGPGQRPASYDFMTTYVDDLPNVLDLDAVREAGVRDRRRPAGRRVGRLLGGDRRAAPARPDGGQPARRPDLAVHDAGLGRQDPDGLLLPQRDGLADQPDGPRPGRRRPRRTPSRPATTPTPTGTASSRPTAG